MDNRIQRNWDPSENMPFSWVEVEKQLNEITAHAELARLCKGPCWALSVPGSQVYLGDAERTEMV